MGIFIEVIEHFDETGKELAWRFPHRSRSCAGQTIDAIIPLPTVRRNLFCDVVYLCSETTARSFRAWNLPKRFRVETLLQSNGG